MTFPGARMCKLSYPQRLFVCFPGTGILSPTPSAAWAPQKAQVTWPPSWALLTTGFSTLSVCRTFLIPRVGFIDTSEPLFLCHPVIPFGNLQKPPVSLRSALLHPSPSSVWQALLKEAAGSCRFTCGLSLSGGTGVETGA